jgi:cyclohexanecarboxylate-CoA ligase/acyl-CoA synthetase
VAETYVPTVLTRYGEAAAARFHSAGVWHEDSLVEWTDRWAAAAPERRAVSDGVRDLDYATLVDQSRRLAAWMTAAGVTRGDRVAVQLPNWAEFVVVYLAATRIGAVTVPIMTVYRRNEVAGILGNSGATLVVTTGVFRGHDHAAMFRDLLSGAAPDAPARRLLLVRAPALAGEDSFDGVLAAQAPGADGGRPVAGATAGVAGADEPHVLIYSSGTESTAKGCLHTWNTLAFTARALAHEVFRMTPEDTMFMPSPVAHSTGIVIGVVTPLLAGAAIHLQDVWEPAEGLRRIEQYRCTITATATPFVTMALQAAETTEADLSSMRAWLCAGAPIPSSLAQRFEAVFTNARLLPLYGCTEVLMATVCQLDDPIERIASSDGAAISEHVELKLIDEQGAEVPRGTVGEILYRGPGAILGYWDDQERTRAAIDAEGWHHCGDLGVLDPDGYLRITGRVKDIIIRGGQNLSALEIEQHVAAHPGVREVAVVSFPDDRLGEKVCAFVVPAADGAPSLEELRTFLTAERGVAVQKAPERLEVVDELPMTATGKIQKYVLRNRVREVPA